LAAALAAAMSDARSAALAAAMSDKIEQLKTVLNNQK
jgi:hypothetical protein